MGDDIDVHPERFLDDVYLRELYDGRKLPGAAARATVEKSFSLSATIPKIAEILKSAASLRRPSKRKSSRVLFRRDLARSAGSSGAVPRR